MPPQRVPLQVLQIEASADDAILAVGALLRAGYDVTARRVETGAEFEQALSEGAWDVVLADVSLPDFEALAALEILRRSDLDVPFMIVAAPAAEARAAAALRAGAQDFIAKGYLARLAPAIERGRREVAMRRQHHQSQQLLGEMEARFQQVWETTTDAMALTDADGLVLAVNPAYHQMFGYSPEQTIGHSFAELLPEAQRPAMIEQYRRVFANPATPGTFEAVVQRADGAERFIESRATFLTSGGQRTAMLSIIRDVTERRRAEEALRNSESLLRESQVIAGLGRYVLDFATGRWESSTILDTIFGIDETYVRTVDGWLELVHPAERQQMIDYFTQEVIGRRVRFDKEYRIIRHNDQAERWVHGAGELEIDAHDRLLTMHGIITDITERKRGEILRRALLEIMEGLAVTDDLRAFLGLAHQAIARVMYAENFFVTLYNEETGLFEEVYSVDRFDPPAAPSRLEKSVSAYVFRSGRPLLLTQARFDELVAQGEVDLVGTNSPSWLGVPLKTSKGPIGVMVVQDYEHEHRYSERDSEFLASMAS